MPVAIIDMEMALANSYKNFHAKGFDYICLERTPKLTRKLYILDGDITKVPEVINPHDHRYSFTTMVMAGAMIDHRWVSSDESDPSAKAYNAFDYMTPLNGGDGFTFRGEEWLRKDEANLLTFAESLATRADRVHTIQMQADQTALMLNQFADIYDLDTPTSAWSQDTPDASDSGLYDRFTPDEIIQRLSLVGITVQEMAA